MGRLAGFRYREIVQRLNTTLVPLLRRARFCLVDVEGTLLENATGICLGYRPKPYDVHKGSQEQRRDKMFS